MMDIVDETLREWRGSQAIYGLSDCMLSIGRYLAKTGHPDVTGLFLGKYDTAEGAEAQMAQHGGIPGLMHLAEALPHNARPARGDVVEVEWADGKAIGGLCTGGMIAMRLQQGVVELRIGLLSIGGVWHGSRR